MLSAEGKTTSSLNFSGGRLVGLAAGLGLSAILGGFLFIAVPTTFVLGALGLALMVSLGLALAIVPSLLADTGSLQRLKKFRREGIA